MLSQSLVVSGGVQNPAIAFAMDLQNKIFPPNDGLGIPLEPPAGESANRIFSPLVGGLLAGGFFIYMKSLIEKRDVNVSGELFVK